MKNFLIIKNSAYWVEHLRLSIFKRHEFSPVGIPKNSLELVAVFNFCCKFLISEGRNP